MTSPRGSQMQKIKKLKIKIDGYRCGSVIGPWKPWVLRLIVVSSGQVAV